ncbi:MAG: site-specific integrase, partial [Firmicutes bacterium]|nr:site-specific integrase [Bacillota bacterium]
MKYKEWLNDWLALYVKPAVKIRTYQKYEQICRVHIAPAVGESDIDKLSSIVLQKFTVSLAEKLSSNTVNNIVTVLQKSLKTAVIVGICKEQFACTVIRPKAKEKRVECFSLAEQKQIEKYALSAVKSKLFGIVLCFYTGLRIGELLALEWSDINFQSGLLSVNKSCHYGKDANGIYARIIDTPKTEQSNRLIPLPKPILSRLKSIQKNCNCKYVISDRDNPVPTRSYQRSFELVLLRLNIPRKGFHALRHTFATRALESGMDVKTLSELLGHKNATVTLNRYVHSLMEHKTDMINRLGKF